MGLAVVRDLREARAAAGPEELAAFETDVLAGFVLARAAAGLADSTIAGDVIHLEQVRGWLGRPLREMQPADADACFGQVLRGAARGTRLARAQALKTYFLFLELRHKVEIHQMTGHVVQCPVDELNRPRGGRDAALRIPPGEAQVGELFAGWRADLAGCRKFAPAARKYTVARLMADVGLRVNEVCQLDLADVKWELGRFGKIHVRIRKGARGPPPAADGPAHQQRAGDPGVVRAGRVVVLLRRRSRPAGAPLLPSERKNPDGTCARVGDEGIRVCLGCGAATQTASTFAHRHGEVKARGQPEATLLVSAQKVEHVDTAVSFLCQAVDPPYVVAWLLRCTQGGLERFALFVTS